MQEGEGGAQARAVTLSDSLPQCAEMLAKISESNGEQEPWIHCQYAGWMKGQRLKIATRLKSSFPDRAELQKWSKCRHDSWSKPLRKFDGSKKSTKEWQQYLFFSSAKIVTAFAATPSSAASLRFLLEKHDDFRSALNIGANSWNEENLSKACKTLLEYFFQPQDQLWEAILESRSDSNSKVKSKVKRFYEFEKTRRCHWLKYCVQLNLVLHMVKVYQEHGFCLNEPITVSLEASADPASISSAVQLTATHQLFGLVTKCIKDGIVTVHFPLMIVRKPKNHAVEFEAADKLPVFAPSFRFTDQDGTNQDGTEIGLDELCFEMFKVLVGTSLTTQQQDLRKKLLRCLFELQQQQGDENEPGPTGVAQTRKHRSTASKKSSQQQQQPKQQKRMSPETLSTNSTMPKPEDLDELRNDLDTCRVVVDDDPEAQQVYCLTTFFRAQPYPTLAILRQLVNECLISEAVAWMAFSRLPDEGEGGQSNNSRNNMRSTMPTTTATATAASVPAAASDIPDDSKPAATVSKSHQLPAETMTNSTAANIANHHDDKRKQSPAAAATVPIVNRDEISVGFSSPEINTSFTQKQSELRPGASCHMPVPSASAIDPDSIDLMLEATPLSHEEESISMTPAELAAMLLGEPVVLAAGTTTSTLMAKGDPRQGPGCPRKDASLPPTTTANGTANEPATKKKGPGRPRKNPLPGANATTEQGQPPKKRKNETTEPFVAAVATQHKRGPGRPRKDSSLPPPPTANTNGTANGQEVPPKKRGPGRPRKNPHPATGEEPPKKKRGPGRPRKNETTAPPVTSAKAAAAAVVTLGKPTEAADIVAGIAAVAQEHPLAVLPNLDEKANSNTTTVTAGATLPKRGPGRPRKHAPKEGAPPPSPKKCGRPPRKHPLLKEAASSVAPCGDTTTVQTTVAAAADDANPLQPPHLPPLKQDTKQAAMDYSPCFFRFRKVGGIRTTDIMVKTDLMDECEEKFTGNDVLKKAVQRARDTGSGVFNISDSDHAKIESEQATLFFSMENGPQLEGKFFKSLKEDDLLSHFTADRTCVLFDVAILDNEQGQPIHDLLDD